MRYHEKAPKIHSSAANKPPINPKMTQNPEVLSTPINDLPASIFFKEGSALMGFGTIQEILNITPKELMSNERFNHVWFGELIDFLTERGLLHLLQPTQGNSRV